MAEVEAVMEEDIHHATKFVVNLDIEHKNAEKDLTKISTDAKTLRQILQRFHMHIICPYHLRQDHRITLFGIQIAEPLTI